MEILRRFFGQPNRQESLNRRNWWARSPAECQHGVIREFRYGKRALLRQYWLPRLDRPD